MTLPSYWWCPVKQCLSPCSSLPLFWDSLVASCNLLLMIQWHVSKYSRADGLISNVFGQHDESQGLRSTYIWNTEACYTYVSIRLHLLPMYWQQSCPGIEKVPALSKSKFKYPCPAFASGPTTVLPCSVWCLLLHSELNRIGACDWVLLPT